MTRQTCALLALSVTAALATGCGGGGSGSGGGGGNTVTVTSVSVTANPSTISTAQTSQCSAAVSGTNVSSQAVTWTVSGPATITQAGVVTPSGVGTVTCIANSTVVGYTNVSGSATITVNSPPPIITTFNATPPTITVGQSSVLTLAATGATTCSIDHGVGALSSCNTTTSVSPTVTTIYTATATYPGGAVTSTATVTVNPPAPTGSISANPSTIVLGSPSTLTITTANATSCSIAGIGTVPCNGTVIVSPGASTAYLFSMTGAGGTNSASTTVAVGGRTAPSGSWQPIGPDGGSITVLSMDTASPSVVYASSSVGGGVWRSTDGGLHWKALITNTPLDQAQVKDIAVTGKTIYVATSGTYFLKSPDNGVTWQQVTVMSGQAIGAMAVDPSAAYTIYLSLPGKGISKSTDGGNTWTLLSGSPVITSGSGTAVLHNPLTVDPLSGTVYYGTDHGFYISNDQGATWQQGTGFASGDVGVWDVAVSPADDTHVFALAGIPGLTVNDLYVSTNKGASWAPLAKSLDAERVTPDLQNVQTVYLFGLQSHGVYKSTNGGLSFSASDSGLPVGSSGGSFVVLDGPTGVMLLVPSSQDALVAWGGGGVYLSQNAEQTWTFSSAGLSSWLGGCIALDPGNPNTLYFGALNGGGIFKSTDRGSTWTNPYSGSVHACAVDPWNSLHILGADISNGLIESRDGGVTWKTVTSLPAPSGQASISGITFNPLQSGTIYISLRGGGLGVIESTNGGQSYFTANTGLTTDQSWSPVAVNPASGNMLFVSTSNGTFKSTDGGATWTLNTTNKFTLLSIDAKTSTPVLYGSVGILAETFPQSSAKSLDLGQTWQPIPYASMIVVDPSTANSLFSANLYTPNAWSPDGGSTWQPVLTNGLGQISTIDANQFGGVAVAPNSPQVLYMISSSNALLRFVVGP